MRKNRDSPYFPKRRSLIIAGALAPLSARAQLFSERQKKVGLLLSYSPDDWAARLRLAAFRTALASRGWEEGGNLALQVRWAEGDAQRTMQYAKELVSQAPDLIVTNSTPVTAAVLRETKSIPVVFVVVSDPVGSGFAQSLAHPGGNATGLINIESSLSEKWVEVLTQIAPRLKRVAVMYNPKTAPYADYYLPRLNAAAARLNIRSFISTVTSPRDIEEAVLEVSRDRASGLVAMTDSFNFLNRNTTIAACARRRVPAVYYEGQMVVDGGLISYGVDVTELFRRAGGYVDRILKGGKPADLPVEQPSKFELFVNAKTAKALKLAIPQELLVRADKVIE
jgi:putative ABC transport system substrate-binding protein